MDENTARSCRPDSLSQIFLSALLPTLALLLIAPAVGEAQVETPPITPTAGAEGLHTTVTPGVNLYDITGGTRPGGGSLLFHSFGDFNVPPNTIANFLNKGSFDLNGTLLADGLATSNILARVTNPNPSSIFGTIQTNGDGGFGPANFFLMNPSGIVFGPHGSVNVGGSVGFTTAQYMRLSDGVTSANFYANPANDGLANTNSILVMDPVANFGFLSSANPVGYGFLTAPDPNATITVQGSALSVTSGQSISLVGGKVVIEGGGQLSAPSGRIHLATTASPGEIGVFPGESLASATSLQSVPNNPVDPASAASFTSYGLVSLAPGSSIGSGTSMVFIKDGQIVLSLNDSTLNTSDDSSTPPNTDTIFLSPGSSIVTSSSGLGAGSDVQFIAGNLSLNGSAITTETLGDGIGGNITADVGALSLANSASINSNNISSGIGQGGKLTIQGYQGADSAADVHLDASSISTGTFGPGQGGDVHITADGLTLENTSGIVTTTQFGDGVGGSLFLNVGTLTVKGGSEIRSTNFNFGTDLDFDGVVDRLGAGGKVTIQGMPIAGSTADPPADSVELSGGSRIISETVVSGDGGQISITAQSLNLGEASTINSSTFGTGLGGNILVRVDGASLSGGATIKTHSDFFDPTAAAGGSITVQGLPGAEEGKAVSLTLTGQGSGIISETSGLARLGDIAVYAKTVNLTDEAVIKAGSPGDPGTAGNVTINADSVGISGRSTISSQASDADAGQVIITADRLTLDNGSIVTSTSSEFFGRGGDVVLNVGTVSLTNAARINSQSGVFSTGRAGDIRMNVGSLTLANHSEITSSSRGTVAEAGDAGNITLNASGNFTSDGSKVSTSAENAKGGDILIDAQSVALSNGTLISASSNAPFSEDGAGDAGNITITSASNIIMQNSSVTTEASDASGGSIEIDASDTGMIQLVNSKVSTSVGGLAKKSDGGNINIDPQFVVLTNSQILAQAFAGAGGAINIIATSAYIKDPVSIVSASSTLGISGPVNIQSPLQNVGAELTALTQEFSSAAALLAQQCAARAADGKFSTFVVAAREGLPAEPGGFLASPSLTAELLGSRLSGRDPQTQLSATTGLFPKHDARPIQLAEFGDSCHW